jgi:nucleoside-diphosphate-sugar epimerase
MTPMTSQNPRVFVVGATGYIGSHLLRSAHKVTTVFGTSSSGKHGLLRLRIEAPSEFDYTQVVPGDVILLTAAISNPDICARDHAQAWAANVTGTSEFIHRVIDRNARVVFFSSDTVYGERAEEFDESSPVTPTGEYAVMKHEVEQQFVGNSSFKTIRLSYVFSREDKFSLYLANCSAKSIVAELFHPFLRAIVHRNDVIEGALSLAMNWDSINSQIVNFGGPMVLSRIDFAESLQKINLPNLHYSVTEPDPSFFINRPRVIAMTSPIFAKLLQRPPRTLGEAALIEYGIPLDAYFPS